MRYYFFIANQTVISGSMARLNIIKLRAVLESKVETEQRLHKVTRLVTNLTHIQALAYGGEDLRTQKNVLAMAGLTFMFNQDFCEVLILYVKNK